MEERSTIDYLSTPTSKPLPRRLPALKELGLVVVILVLGGVLSIAGYHRAQPGQPNTFLNPTHLFVGVATPMSYYSIMAVGMTFVIIAGGIDISVGSTMGMAAFVAAEVLVHLPTNMPGLLIVLITFAVPLAVGLFCGLLNGALVVGLKMHPFIVTLGTLSILRGLTNAIPDQKEIPFQGQPLPSAFTDHFMLWEFRGQRPVPLAIMLAVMFIGWFYLSCTAGGREIYALGGNEEAARFSGLRINRIKLKVYAIAGVCAGLAGMVSLGTYCGTSTNTGFGYELTVVAAAVVGGASLNGGRGTALGALLGTLIIAMIEDGIPQMGWNEEYSKVIVGCAIIGAVAIDYLSQYIGQRRLAGAKARGFEPKILG